MCKTCAHSQEESSKGIVEASSILLYYTHPVKSNIFKAFHRSLGQVCGVWIPPLTPHNRETRCVFWLSLAWHHGVQGPVGL